MGNEAKLSFHGAAGGVVTGSCYLLRSRGATVVVDCGIFQGDRRAEAWNRKLPPVKPGTIDAVVLTHAHLDHCGRLPLLARAGYAGPIYATQATIELTGIILRDAAAIQESDAEQESRRRMRAGKSAVEPLYTKKDAERALRLLRPVEYEEVREVAPGISARLIDAGHILGSGSLRVTLHEPGNNADHGSEQRSIVFSADVGQRGSPILRDPEHFGSADTLIMESTYGDRDHKPIDQTIEEFARVVSEAVSAGGKVLIPAFAVGRTQDLVYHLGNLRRDGRVPRCPVYVDSPMASAATKLYAGHESLHDEPSVALAKRKLSPVDFPGLHYVKTAEQSRKLNDQRGCVIIASSGMCTGGRILHHLRHALWQDSTHVVFVGFQARGTLGRELVDGAKRVRIFRETIVVKAQIHTIGGFSAHAGQTQLVEWCRPLADDPRHKPEVYLTHGEDRQRRALAKALKAELGLRCHLPGMGDVVGV